MIGFVIGAACFSFLSVATPLAIGIAGTAACSAIGGAAVAVVTGASCVAWTVVPMVLGG